MRTFRAAAGTAGSNGRSACRKRRPTIGKLFIAVDTGSFNVERHCGKPLRAASEEKERRERGLSRDARPV
jgi:hypothetical protein